MGNLWIWRIFAFSAFIGLLTVAASIFLYLSFKKGKSNLIFALFALILIFQWKTTEVGSLTQLTNDQKRVQAMRLKEYPSKWLRVGHWFEERPESIAFFRILENFSEVVDPNLYFFANHPRERVGVNEFEKFPYVFLPFFFYGLFWSTRKAPSLVLALALPTFLVSFIGHKNPIGPFSLFPFFSVTLAIGLERVYLQISKKYKVYQRLLMIGSFIIFLLVFIQTVAYAFY